MKHKVNLTVHQSQQEDVYHDRARIPEAFRGGIREHQICKISVAGNNTLVELRGMGVEKRAIIRLDDVTRDSLGVDDAKPYDFTIRTVGWIGKFLWAWNASDPAPRLAARLGILGLILGLIALVLGVVPLVKGC